MALGLRALSDLGDIGREGRGEVEGRRTGERVVFEESGMDCEAEDYDI